MSTVPKLTYAKVGKGSKAKAESASSELTRSKGEKSNDIFSQMNQQNLNYIKKQLKLKKNRSEHQRPQSPERNGAERSQQQDEQVTQRHRLYQKYRGEEEVSEKEPHLEDTQRRSDQSKGVGIILPEEIEEDYDPSENNNSRPFLVEKQFISTSQHGMAFGKPHEKEERVQSKMYQSLPYEDARQRISSIEGYFGQAVSANLNKQEGQFMQFLEEYISDLNHSKHLKSRENDQPEKQRNDGYLSQRKQTIDRQAPQQTKNIKIEHEIRENMKKLERLNRNSDTFGERNSKYTVKSHDQSLSEQRGYLQLEQKLKEEKLNTLMLAQQIERQRKLLSVKQNIIKKIETDNDLLREELRHVKTQQQIINKRKKSVPSQGYTGGYGQANKPSKAGNNQNQLHFYEAIGPAPNSHQRNASNNPHRTANSYRGSLRHAQERDLFQQFGEHNYTNGPLSRQKKNKKENESLEKWQREYSQFLLEEKKNNKYVRGSRKSREGLL